MSRTDRTRPSAVRVMEDPSYLEEWHRCAEFGIHHGGTGECDLPPRPTGRAWAPGARWGDTICHWTPSHAFWRSADGACRCPRCMGEDYEMPRRIRERRQGKAAAHDAERENFHGLHDDLSDVFDWSMVKDDPDFDNTSDFHIEIREFADLAERLDLPAGVLVVATGYLDGHRCCSSRGGLYGVHDHPATHAEVLHPDGRRERIPVNRNDEAVPGGFGTPEVADLDDYDFGDPADYLDDIDADLYSERMRGPQDPAWYREATGAPGETSPFWDAVAAEQSAKATP